MDVAFSVTVLFLNAECFCKLSLERIDIKCFPSKYSSHYSIPHIMSIYTVTEFAQFNCILKSKTDFSSYTGHCKNVSI